MLGLGTLLKESEDGNVPPLSDSSQHQMHFRIKKQAREGFDSTGVQSYRSSTPSISLTAYSLKFKVLTMTLSSATAAVAVNVNTYCRLTSLLKRVHNIKQHNY